MTLPADINDFLDPILRTFESQLTANVQGHLVTGYLKGSAEMLEWGRTKLTDMPIFYEGPPMEQAMTYAQKRAAKLVTEMTPETKEQMRGVIEKAIKQKRGIPGLSRDLRKQFTSMSRVRAKMIARTETADALESAFMDRAKDMKVTGKEWVVTDPCPICEENGNAGVIPINKPFPSGDMRPPAHPNAVLAESPFFTYGSLYQIVRSRYSGLARTIQTDRVSFTIGPNHPILTRRGWIKASEIYEGDQLLYDSRTEYSGVSSVKAYLDQMPTIQDVFNSLRSSFGYTTIASPSTYFHGDEVFAYGKIDVVLPTTDLLLVLDISGIEQFCQNDFMGANANKVVMAAIGSCHHSPDRVFVPSSGSMGSTCLMETLSWGHVIPSCFKSTTVTHIEPSYYDGWAYDASTQYGLYNSSGIIVKNCRCALAPVMLK